MRQIIITILRVFVVAVVMLLLSCEEPFDPASLIKKRRFLAIVAEPLEAAPGGVVTVTAVVADADGSLYEGPVVWSVVGGDMLRVEGQTEAEAAESFIQQPAGEPFVWAVPDQQELARRYGPGEENGWMLTIGASVFESGNLFGGNLVGEPIPAYKLFVVSNRDVADRMANPQLDPLSVTRASGDQLSPNETGIYETTSSKVILRALPKQSSDRYSFHWFSTYEDFEPDDTAVATLKPAEKGLVRTYCVLRKAYFFEHDDQSRTRITGIDWEKASVRFK